MAIARKITDLAVLSAAAAADTLVIVDDPAGGAATKKISASAINLNLIRTAAEIAAGITPTNLLFEPGDVRRYGALIDSSTDDFQAFTNALATGHPVTIPEGTMIVNSIVLVTSSAKITGAGKGKTIIDGTGITTTTDGVIVVKGILTQREDPSVNISQFDKSITFASAPTFSDNQVGLIWNPTANSYSGFRTNYHKGEFFQVQDVAAQLDLNHQLYSAYTAANVDIYSLDGVEAHISDLTVLAPDNNAAAIKLQYCVHSTLTNIDGRNSSDGAIHLNKCFDVSVLGCTGIDRNDIDHAMDTALEIINCQSIRVSNGYFAARRHAIVIAQDAQPGGVVNRDIVISNNVLYSFANAGAADVHGNAEFVTYSNNQINGGVSSWGGNKNKFINNSVYGQTDTSIFAFSEMTGLDHLITGNYFESNGGGSATRGWGLDIGGNDTSTLTSNTGASGTLKITNNTWIDTATSATSNAFAFIKNQGATVDLNIEFCGNTIQAADANTGRLIIDQVTGNEWKNVVICDNTFSIGNILILSSEFAFVCRNIIHDGIGLAGQEGINVSLTVNNGVAHIIGNIVKGATDVGIQVLGSAATGDTAYVKDNTVTTSGGSFDIDISSVVTVYLLNNIGSAIRIITSTDAFAFGNLGPVTFTTVTNATETGFDSAANLIMRSLPTSTPGGSDRVWNNANVLNIT